MPCQNTLSPSTIFNKDVFSSPLSKGKKTKNKQTNKTLVMVENIFIKTLCTEVCWSCVWTCINSITCIWNNDNIALAEAGGLNVTGRLGLVILFLLELRLHRMYNHTMHWSHHPWCQAYSGQSLTRGGHFGEVSLKAISMTEQNQLGFWLGGHLGGSYLWEVVTQGGSTV